MLLSSGVVWRHRAWEDFRRECPGGDEALQRLVWERLDSAIAWLCSLGAEPTATETGNPLTSGARFDPRALTAVLAGGAEVRLADPAGDVPQPLLLCTGGFSASPQLVDRYIRPAAPLRLRGNRWSTRRRAPDRPRPGSGALGRARRVLRPQHAGRAVGRDGARFALPALRPLRTHLRRAGRRVLRGERRDLVGDERRRRDGPSPGRTRLLPAGCGEPLRQGARPDRRRDGGGCPGGGARSTRARCRSRRRRAPSRRCASRRRSRTRSAACAVDARGTGARSRRTAARRACGRRASTPAGSRPAATRAASRRRSCSGWPRPRTSPRRSDRGRRIDGVAGETFDTDEVFDDDYLVLLRARSAAVSDADAETIWRMLSLDRGSEVLDLACGHGRIANRLAARGARVTGLDTTPSFLERARAEARPSAWTSTTSRVTCGRCPGPRGASTASSAGSRRTGTSTTTGIGRCCARPTACCAPADAC